MILSVTHLLCLLAVNIKTSTAQFMPAIRKASKSACDGPNKTALVEQFFNVIFTEFHNSPPICVCVQMCADQPTYCYPNGCLKQVDNRRKIPEETKPPAPVTNIQNDDISNTMFLVENDFNHLMNENVEINKNVNAEQFSIKDMRPDPFKDRYKTLFKYKKMPLVELRYNLREQVKNMKSDILKVETQDVSKTRWPKNNYMVIREQQKFKMGDNTNEPKPTDVTSTKFFIQSPEIDRDLYSQKFFKRDLRRNIKDDIEIQSEGLPETPDNLETKTFSLETLIDNLIGNNFVRKLDGDLELKEYPNNTQTVAEVTTTSENTHNNITKDDKEITCVVSLNKTSENLDENKYEGSPLIKKHLDKWKNYTFNEMIAALSKRIDIQNNTSLEIMKEASKDKIEVIITGPINNLKVKDHLKIIDDVNKVKNKTKIISTTDSHTESSTEEITKQQNKNG